MAKGKVRVEVEANTTKAAKQLKAFKQQAEKSTRAFGNGLDGADVPTGFSRVLDKLGKQMDGFKSANAEGLSSIQSLVPGLNSAEGAMGKLGNVVTMMSNPVTALAGGFVALGAAVNAGMQKMVDLGAPAAAALGKVTTELDLIDKNIGGSRSMEGMAKELQKMSANGVNSFEDLGKAASLLNVAFDGNTSKSMELLRMFDDLAAATGMSAQDWAGMAAEVKLSGVSIKDLTRLSNRGIPIYQAFADTLGVTAEQAEAMAKAGQIGVEEWLAAATKLHERYKGLSETMSSNTIEGAQATFDASKGMKYQAAAESFNDERIKYLNKASDEMQRFAENPAWNELIGVVGGLKGEFTNFGDVMKEVGEGILTGLPIQVGRMVADLDGAVAEGVKARNSQKVADVTRGVNEAIGGQLSVGQIEDLLQTMYKGRVKYSEAGLSEDTWQRMIAQVEKALEVAKAAADAKATQDDAAARAERARVATAKYGTLDDKVKAMSGRNYAPIMLSPDELAGAVEQLKKGLMDGAYEDVKTAEDTLEALEKMLKEYQSETEAAARASERAEKELADTRKKAADEALKAKIAVDNAQIAGKAKALKDVNEAQQDYNKITKELADLQDDRALQLAEEEHGIYRDKWRDLNMASYDTKEAKLLDAQKEAAQKLADQKKALETFDQRWESARSGLNRFLNTAFNGTALRVQGTAAAG